MGLESPCTASAIAPERGGVRECTAERNLPIYGIVSWGSEAMVGVWESNSPNINFYLSYCKQSGEKLQCQTHNKWWQGPAKPQAKKIAVTKPPI